MSVGRPTLSGGFSGSPRGAVLVLPGGRVHSRRRLRPWHLAYVRMFPFARSLRGQPGLAVYRLRYRLRGWNRGERSPVGDGRWALREIRRRHGEVPVVLLGHSMGARVAVHLADDPAVVGVVCLAPWWPHGDASTLRPGQRVLVMHGTADHRTDLLVAREETRRARQRGVEARWQAVEGGDHAMLRGAGRWHREATEFALQVLRDSTDGAVSTERRRPDEARD